MREHVYGYFIISRSFYPSLCGTLIEQPVGRSIEAYAILIVITIRYLDTGSGRNR